MTPLEAANRLIEIKTTADAHSDSIQWSSEDVAYFNDLCIDHATGMAEALIVATAEIERLRRALHNEGTAYHAQETLATRYQTEANKLRAELMDIDRITAAFGDPQWNGEYISNGLIARRVQDAAMLWQRETERRTTAETKLKGAEAMILELTRVLARQERALAQIQSASEEMLREEGQ